MPQSKDQEPAGEPEKDLKADVADDAVEAAWLTEEPLATPPESPEGIDPELVSLPAPKRARHPIVSLAVVGLSIYLMANTRADLLYFFEAREPQQIGDVTELARQSKLDTLQENSFVTISGSPDRKHALLLEGRVSGYNSFFRLLNTDDRLFVQRHRKERSTGRDVVGRHSGRLMRLKDLPYAKPISLHMEQRIGISHDLSLDGLIKAKQSNASTIKDSKGRTVNLSGETLLWINVSYKNVLVLQFDKSSYPKSEDVSKALLTIATNLSADDLKPKFVQDSEDSKKFWRVVTIAEGKLAQKIFEMCKDRKLKISAVPRVLSYTAPWGQLEVKGGDLVITKVDVKNMPKRVGRRDDGELFLEDLNAATAIKLRDKRFSTTGQGPAKFDIAVSGRFKMPDNALVLVANSEPPDFWYVLVIYVLLGCFVLLNLMALVTGIRRRLA